MKLIDIVHPVLAVLLLGIALPNIVLGDDDPTFTAPSPAGKVLIIYNRLGHGFEFSQPGMSTVFAALTGDASHLDLSTIDPGSLPTQSDIPAISPTPRVDTLNIDKVGGVYTNLIARFGSEIPDSLKGGRELEFWDLVFDIRFANKGNSTAEGVQTISIDNTPTSDMNLYKSLLASGGGLYLQAEYNYFPARNRGVASCINFFCVNENFDAAKIPGGSNFALTSGSYSSTPENFNKDFNDLTALSSSEQPKVQNGGPYPLADLRTGTSLITHGGGSLIHLWDSRDLVMGNGRLMVGFDINMFADHKVDFSSTGEIRRGTFALLQNMYDLLGGVRDYEVTKTFIPVQGDLGDPGRFEIAIINQSDKLIRGFTMTDTISTCLTVTGTSSSQPSVTTETITGNVYTWEVEEVAANSNVTITVNFTSNSIPPCP